MTPKESLDSHIQRFESHLNHLDPTAKDSVFSFFVAFGLFEEVLKRKKIYENFRQKWGDVSKNLVIDFSKQEISGLKTHCESFRESYEVSWSRTKNFDGSEKYKSDDSDEYKLIRTISSIRNSLFHGAKITNGIGEHQIQNIQKAYAALARIIEDNKDTLQFSSYVDEACWFSPIY